MLFNRIATHLYNSEKEIKVLLEVLTEIMQFNQIEVKIKEKMALKPPYRIENLSPS
jgi:hypothetical protein